MNSDVYVFLVGITGSVIAGGPIFASSSRKCPPHGQGSQHERRLQAYADLLIAAGEVLGTYRRDLYSMSSDFGQHDADKANAHMADLVAVLHRASAVVALTATELGREQGKRYTRPRGRWRGAG